MNEAETRARERVMELIAGSCCYGGSRVANTVNFTLGC